MTRRIRTVVVACIRRGDCCWRGCKAARTEIRNRSCNWPCPVCSGRPGRSRRRSISVRRERRSAASVRYCVQPVAAGAWADGDPGESGGRSLREPEDRPDSVRRAGSGGVRSARLRRDGRADGDVVRPVRPAEVWGVAAVVPEVAGTFSAARQVDPQELARQAAPELTQSLPATRDFVQAVGMFDAANGSTRAGDVAVRRRPERPERALGTKEYHGQHGSLLRVCVHVADPGSAVSDGANRLTGQSSSGSTPE